jgi:sugar phosphate permease
MRLPRYRWVVLAAGTFAQASFSCTTIGLPALAVALRSRYGLTLSETGVVLAGTGIGMLFTLLPWGLLADRLDERWVITAGLTGAAAMLFVTAETSTFATLTGSLVAVGALGAAVNAASGRAIMGWFPRTELGLALGIRQTAIPIGGATGAAVLTALASAGGTRLAFIVLGAACAAGALVAAAFMRGPPVEDAAAPDTALPPAGPLRERSLWLLAGGTGLYLTAQIGLTTFVVLFLHDDRHVSKGAAGAVLVAINVLAIGARIGAGLLSDRVGTRLRPLRAIGLVVAGGSAAIALLARGPLPLLVVLFLATGMLSMSWNGLSFAAAAETAGAGRTGAALGFQQTVLGLVVAVFPPLFAVVADSSWRLAFVLAAAGPLLGTALLRFVPEPRSRRLARTPGTSATPQAARRTPD